jgi:hypothetical protein
MKGARPDVTGRAWEAKLRQYLQDHPEAFDPETIDFFVSALDEATLFSGLRTFRR